MSKRVKISAQNRNNWLLDATVFIGGVLAALSGIYFLYLPSGGYQGGRNPTYGVTVLFDRHTWDDLHTWSGMVMIAAAAIHLVIHWNWIKMMVRRSAKAVMSRERGMPRFVLFNIAINAVVALSFLLTTVSGVYFLFAPSGGFQGGSNPDWDPAFLFSRTTWDLFHTWAGVTLIGAVAVHFWIHWRWVKNVTKKLFLSLLPQPRAGESTAEARV